MINISLMAKNALNFAKNPQISSNAQITFNQSSGEVLNYDEVGNPILTPGILTPFVIDCYLWQTKSDQFTNNQKSIAGVDNLSNYYIGRLVSPKTYQFPIRADGEITVTFNGRTGRIMELMTLETSYAIDTQLSNNLGQRFQCYIEFAEGN